MAIKHSIVLLLLVFVLIFAKPYPKNNMKVRKRHVNFLRRKLNPSPSFRFRMNPDQMYADAVLNRDFAAPPPPQTPPIGFPMPKPVLYPTRPNIARNARFRAYRSPPVSPTIKAEFDAIKKQLSENRDMLKSVQEFLGSQVEQQQQQQHPQSTALLSSLLETKSQTKNTPNKLAQKSRFVDRPTTFAAGPFDGPDPMATPPQMIETSVISAKSVPPHPHIQDPF